MPCRSYEDDFTPSHSYEIQQLQDKIDRLARIACRAMTALEKASPEDAVFKNEEQITWWTAHKIADAKAEEERKILGF
jgi:hypothetical protein